MQYLRPGFTTANSSIKGYAAALLLSLFALGVILVAGTQIGPSPFVVYTLAVILSAGYGGFGPGLFAILFGIITSALFLVPTFGIIPGTPDGNGYFIRFAVSSLLVTIVAAYLRLSQRRIGLLQRQTVDILESISDGFLVLDNEWRFSYINPKAAEMSRRQPEKILGKNVWEEFPEMVNTIYDQKYHQAVAEQKPVRFENLNPAYNRWLAVHAYPSQRGLSIYLQDVTERKRAEEQAQILLEANTILSASLDYEVTLKNLVNFIVPRLANWCAIDLVEESGASSRLTLLHKDPEKVALAYELRRRYPPDPNAASGTMKVMRTGISELIREVSDEMLVKSVPDEALLGIMRQLGLTSSMVVAITLRGEILGAITMVSSELGRHYDEEDLRLAENLAQRAATAIDNARLYQEARDQRQRLQVTLASIGDAVIATDTNGCVTFMNHVAESLTGWSESEAAGQELQTVFQIVNEDTHEPVENPVSKVMREGGIVGLANHTILIAKDGQEVAIDDSGAPIKDEKGNITGVIVIFRDIFERKQAEQAQRFLVEASTALSASLDYKATIANLSHHAVSYLADWCVIDILEADGAFHRVAAAAADPDKEPLVQKLKERYPKLEPTAQHTLLKVFQSRKSWIDPDVSPERLAAEARDPDHLQLEQALGFKSEMVVPLMARERMVGTITLVSASRSYTEEDLILANDLARRAASAIDNARLYYDAKRAVQAREEFLSVAAHELRTPMTTLRGFAQMLARELDKKDGMDASRMHRSAQLIEDQSRKLSLLVSQLLDVSRIEAGRLTLNKRLTDVAALTQNVVASAQLNTHRHTILVTAPESLQASVDPLRLEQVMTNLIDNAIKFSPQGGEVAVELSHLDSNSLRLTVTDHGVGIAPEHRERIFERFYQVPVHGHPEGMGIGLHVSREIVILHAGTIHAEFPEGGGTRFVVNLPVNEPASKL